MKKQAKFFIAAIVLLLLGLNLIVWYTVYGENEKRKEFAMLENDTSSVLLVRKEISKISNTIKELKTGFRMESNQSIQVLLIEKTAKEKGIVIKNLKIGNTKSSDVQSVPVEINLTGSYRSLGSFIADFESGLYPVNVSHLMIQHIPGITGLVDITLKMDFISLK
jgi:Tfp pilus assembly protein PilO